MTLPSSHSIVDPVVVTVPEDTKYVGDILERILYAIQSQGARSEAPAPSTYALPLQARSTRLRCEFLVLACDAAATITYRVGAGTRHTYVFGGADTKIIPIYENIEPGLEASLTATAGNVNAYLIGYVEPDVK